MTTSLTIHNVDENIALGLKRRAESNGRSTEAEHREILKDALQKSRRRPFSEVLASMPDVGKDDDFDARGDPG